MCAVSMVSDHYREKWPFPTIPMYPYNPDPFKDDPFKDIIKQIGKKTDPDPEPQMHVITAAQWKEYQELKRKAAEYDARTNQPDCAKPDIDEWENDIEAFLILMGMLTEEDFA